MQTNIPGNSWFIKKFAAKIFFFFIKTDFLFCKFWVTHILSAGLNDLNIKKSEKNDFLLLCPLKGADRGVFRA